MRGRNSLKGSHGNEKKGDMGKKDHIWEASSKARRWTIGEGQGVLLCDSGGSMGMYSIKAGSVGG